MGNVPPFVDRDDLELAEDGSGPEEEVYLPLRDRWTSGKSTSGRRWRLLTPNVVGVQIDV